MLVLVSLVYPQSGLAQATNDSGLSLVIRGPTNIIKQGDEIPIQFIISNQGKEDFKCVNSHQDRNGRLGDSKLIARNASGEIVPDPLLRRNPVKAGGPEFALLHPGESMTRIIPLNLWALIREPGRYEVEGTYSGSSYTGNPVTINQRLQALIAGRPEPTNGPDFSIHAINPLSADPISITVLPRTKQEMDDYIQDLSDQVAARLEMQAKEKVADPVLEELSVKLTYTCSPEAVPALLRIMCEAGFWVAEDDAIVSHIPHTQETRQAILEAVTRRGLSFGMRQLLQDYDFTNQALKPVIERALGVLNPGEWQMGAMLASRYYDDAFTPRLIAIANDTNSQTSVRAEAINALAANRTDAGVKTLKTLLKDPDWKIAAIAEQAIRHAYTAGAAARGKPLRPDDFDANLQYQ